VKIEINYDLLYKINEAKTGFSLDKSAKYILPRMLAASTLFALLNLSQGNMYERFMRGIMLYLVLYGTSYSLSSLILKNTYKDIAIEQLKLLSCKLKDIHISTNYELLQKSYQYKTNYKIKFNESFIPRLKQDKYIMVPTYVNGEEKETSLVQEHIIGSKSYSLSYGSPKKVLKPAFNSI